MHVTCFAWSRSAYSSVYLGAVFSPPRYSRVSLNGEFRVAYSVLDRFWSLVRCQAHTRALTQTDRHTHTHARTHAHKQTHSRAHTHTHTHTHTHARTLARTHARTHSLMLHVHLPLSPHGLIPKADSNSMIFC